MKDDKKQGEKKICLFSVDNFPKGPKILHPNSRNVLRDILQFHSLQTFSEHSSPSIRLAHLNH